MQQRVCKAEQRAIAQHRMRLSEERGHEVSEEDARFDWSQHCARQWRAQHLAAMLAREREEILRHKWIESEKARRDLGSEAALDWIRNHAAQWRSWYDEQAASGQ